MKSVILIFFGLTFSLISYSQDKLLRVDKEVSEYYTDTLYSQLNCFYRADLKEYEGLYYSYFNICNYSASGIKILESDNLNIIKESDQLRIITNDNADNGDFRLYDINGRLVKQCKVRSVETLVNISNLPTGIYVASLLTKNSKISKKIII